MLEARDLLGPMSGTRVTNRQRMIIEIMIKADRQSRIARRSGVSQALVSTAVQELTEQGVVDGTRNRSGQVRLAPARGVAIGVEISHNQVVVVARRVDQPYDRFVPRHHDGGANWGMERLLRTITDMITEAVEETGQTMADVVSAGVSVPRMIDPRTGRFTRPVLLPWHDHDDPAAELSGILGVPVAIDNDANLGAMAEQIYGMDEPAETVVYVKATTGVGAGIMIGDMVYRGHRGMAGEIGHLTIDRDGDVCECGGRGCLDTIVGADALMTQVRTSHRGTAADVPQNLLSLIEKAHAGDAVCTRVLRDAGRTLGIALAQLCNLVNPRLIVLGGELANGKDHVLTPCEQELHRYALSGTVDRSAGFTVRLSQLTPHAEALGALILGLRSRSNEDRQPA
ncbi:transcriptional regulator, ROK family protein [Actinophytocola xinjiangensis]|uniref:Transcriptional regulator, ROK family protein n=1 Tax=Actinophytocola xinjiangensis TaxID=485602 RepID=A0A7Z0WPY6_9PSEU|nr:ROK family transcriptional regulator [Actinophytocola xinjiangensis]OLF12793.1 transcriptional regulator, ROK family protein [Actinophytocola xinjiangensis]